MAAAGKHCPPEQAQRLQQELLDAALSLALPPPLLAAHVAALATVAADGAWAPPLLTAAERVVAAFVERVQANTMPADVDGVCTALFAIGEAAVASGCAVASQVVVLVQALLSPVHTLGRGEGAQCVVPSRVQALAWTTLGKLCLVNAALAKRCAPVFVQELARTPLPAIRNNILVVLRDLCVHFTALVDGHVPTLLRATYDTHVLVRTQALALLANLLQKVRILGRGTGTQVDFEGAPWMWGVVWLYLHVCWGSDAQWSTLCVDYCTPPLCWAKCLNQHLVAITTLRTT